MNPTVTDTVNLESPDDVALADRMKQGRDRIITELRKLIVGQDDIIGQVLLTLFVGGNSLIVGVPGLAKTLLIHTLAKVLDLKFNRIQFTPDLMPSDITGTDIIQEDTDDRPAADGVRARADLREHRARRRDQPDAAEDAVGAARGDAGAPRHDPGAHLQARGAVLRVRDAEPDRARGHLSAARGAARSLHVPHRDRPPARRRGVRGRADHDRRCRTRSSSGRSAATT